MVGSQARKLSPCTPPTPTPTPTPTSTGARPRPSGQVDPAGSEILPIFCDQGCKDPAGTKRPPSTLHKGRSSALRRAGTLKDSPGAAWESQDTAGDS
ncbi:hypothetical protein Pmani_040180 [Petrolisthes manimaculis]|uniref:Uncharacterized protein n=1 Tax=Petrolisthes manimaculis TaxID=1843537 RepID=A0AAE1TKL0_9EUCA|nr:hypothetical protein Pmani_040180 [Petrolisthes manimaculis]